MDPVNPELALHAKTKAITSKVALSKNLVKRNFLKMVRA